MRAEVNKIEGNKTIKKKTRAGWEDKQNRDTLARLIKTEKESTHISKVRNE